MQCLNFAPIFNLAGICLLEVNNTNTIKRYEMCAKLTKKATEQRHWARPGVFIINLDYISHLALVFLLLTLNM